MPTIEIISVGAGVGPYTNPAKHFAQRCDNELVSDRSLFQDDLKELEGVIIHLGDYSDTPNDPCWFCGHFVEYLEGDEEGNHFRIKNDAYQEFREVLISMQRQSPNGHVIFLSDFQFGPDEAQRVDLNSIDDLDDLNRDTAIRYNTLYHINRNSEQGVALKMEGKSLILKLCFWPHSFWLGFLIGILIGWFATQFFSDFDPLLTESGKRVLIFSCGMLCASGSTLDVPSHQSDRYKKSSVFRRRLRHLLTVSFIISMTYAFVFLAPEPKTEQSGRDRISKVGNRT